MKVIFKFANGVKKNAPVRVAGVDEGTVKDIQLFFDREDGVTKVEIDIWINQDTQIPKDSTVTINQLGLLGEKYVEVFPGLDTKEFLKDGDVIIGKDPIAQEVISAKVMDVVNKFEQSIAGFNRLINDDRNVTSIGDTLENLSKATGGLKDMIADLREGRGTAGKILYDERLYDNLEGFTADLKENPWKLLYRPKKKR